MRDGAVAGAGVSIVCLCFMTSLTPIFQPSASRLFAIDIPHIRWWLDRSEEEAVESEMENAR